MNNANRLVCLYGPKRSGKGTVADLLVAEGYTPVACADPVRNATAAAYGLDLDWFRELSTNHETKEVPRAELNGRTPRDVLIDIGMYFRNNVNRDHWSQVARVTIERILRRGGKVVLTDCRFANEATMVQDMGGLVVGVCRPETWAPGPDLDKAEAAVYAGWDDVVDLTIGNAGTLDDLHNTVKALISEAGRNKRPALQTFEVGDIVGFRHPLPGEPNALVKRVRMDGDRRYLDLTWGAPERPQTGTFPRGEVVARVTLVDSTGDATLYPSIPGYR